MSKVLVGVVFGVAIGGCLLAADVFTQYQKAKVNDAPFSAAAYVDGITVRMQQAKAEKQAQAAAEDAAQALAARRATPPRDFLPTAMDGWTRRAWQDGDRHMLSGGNGMDMSLMSEAHEVGADLTNPFTMGAKIAARQKETQWVYERDGAYVVLSAKLKPSLRGNTRQQSAMNLALANMQMMDVQQPFGAYAGVVWTQSLNGFGGDGGDGPLRLKADLGGEVLLRATANAPEPELRALLAGIDYEGLNGLLAQPLDYVSAAHPAKSLDQQIEYATAYLNVARAASAEERAQLEADMKAAFQLTPAEQFLSNAAGHLNGQIEAGKADPALAESFADVRSLVSVADGNDAVDIAQTQEHQDAPAPTAVVAEALTTEGEAGSDASGSGLVGGLLSMFGGGTTAQTIDVVEEAEAVAEQQKGFASRLFGSGSDAPEADDTTLASSGEVKPVVINRLVNQRQGSGCAGGTFCKAPGVED